MNRDFIIDSIAKDLGLKKHGVHATVELFENDATIPFIARYRKEKTGGLDENEIRAISEKHEYYLELEKRKETILKTIRGLGKLTRELNEKITGCTDKTKLEDLYLPYKPKKRTRAAIAKEKGLEPLAAIIYAQEKIDLSRDELVAAYINPGLGVESAEDALAGALDIIAEWIADEEYLRGWIRTNVKTKGILAVKAKPRWREEKSKFMQYYDYREALMKIPSHRLLAISRGSDEGVLAWRIETDEDAVIDFMNRMVIKNNTSPFVKELTLAVEDSFKRLIYPSLEKEAFNLKLDESGIEAIRVFSKNVQNLLLAPPAGFKVIMGIDPGFRTGCKIAVIGKNGDLLEYATIYPFEGKSHRESAAKKIAELSEKHRVELIAIGNGTASKETLDIVKESEKQYRLKVEIVTVSEAGASVYSASKLAGEEFPELDVTIRGAISIGRRLKDPLAELVKIDPKSIGVGQYQHDVDQKELKHSLDLTVSSCVNFVGVDLNTASVPLLSYVSGISKGIAENIASYRTKHGSFKTRNELLEVDKLGVKAFEQCAGFLRIRESENLLDNTGIHPETYPIVEKIAADARVDISGLVRNKEALNRIELKKYVTPDFGLPTLKDIVRELKKPGFDPRREFASIQFSSDINTLEDLEEGMILSGTVTNVTNFGAFVDIGVHQDGLIHISKLANRFVSDPYEIVSVGDTVRVKVLSVDRQLKRISLERLVE